MLGSSGVKGVLTITTMQSHNPSFVIHFSLLITFLSSSTESDLIPVEVIAHGTQAKKAYHEAVSSGTKKVYQTRLMLMGEEGVGKTSLKNALLGKR